MTFRQLLREGADALKHAGISEAEYDARSLLYEAFDMNLADYLFRAEEEADPEASGRFRALIGRRCLREPLQYILGTAPFYGRDFLVEEGVLIPRFDTETLVEGLCGFLAPGMRLLDLCTGSGCILLTLLLEGPEGMEGTGSDISEKALEIAGKNAERLNVRADFVKSDLFEKISGTYDIITANPPYIRSGEIASLAPEVAAYEPRPALDGGGDGLSFYRRIAKEAPSYLHEGGILGFEIGYDQSEDVAELMKENGFGSIRVRRDLGWNTRAVIGTYMK